MPYETIASGLTVQWPTKGTTNWNDTLKANLAQKVSEHDHTGGGKGLQIGGSALANTSVTAAKLAADAVETAKIKDLNVTAGKLATDAVETAKIKDDAVTGAKIRLANAEYLRARNAAGTADIDVLKVSATDDTALFADTGKVIGLAIKGGNSLQYNGTALVPSSNNGQDLGSSSYRIRRLHLGSGIEMPVASVSAAGNSQATATEISPCGTTRITSGSAPQGVRFSASTAGDFAQIVNETSTDNLVIYPASGEYLNGALNGGNLIQSHSSIWLRCYTAGKWAVTN